MPQHLNTHGRRVVRVGLVDREQNAPDGAVSRLLIGLLPQDSAGIDSLKQPIFRRIMTAFGQSRQQRDGVFESVFPRIRRRWATLFFQTFVFRLDSVGDTV